MKKFLAAASVLALTLPAIASASTENFSGGYAGLQVGLGHTKIDTTLSIGATSSKSNYGTSGFIANILAGYGQAMDSAYVGLEAEAGMQANNDTHDSNNLGGKDKYTPKERFVVSGRLGYLLTQKAMVFLKLGVGLENNQYAFTVSNKTFTTKKRDMVFVPGIGTEIMMTESLSFRLDATYTIGKKRTITTANLASIGATNYNSHTYTPKNLSTKIGLVYRF